MVVECELKIGWTAVRKRKKTEEEIAEQHEGKFSEGYAGRNALKQGGKVRAEREGVVGWNERHRRGRRWLLETVKRGR